MMKAYFLVTNGSNDVILTDGDTAKVFDGAPDGVYEGVDLYRTDADERIDAKGIARSLAFKFRFLESKGELNDYADIYSPDEIEYTDVKDELENAIMFYTSNRYKVEYSGGESRYNPGMAVDYMLVNVDGVELYAEIPVVDGDDCASMNDLVHAIINQAIDRGISPLVLSL